MEVEVRHNDLKAQFRASMVIVRHVVDECPTEELGKDMYRELNKQAEHLRKKYGFKSDRNSVN